MKEIAQHHREPGWPVRVAHLGREELALAIARAGRAHPQAAACHSGLQLAHAAIGLVHQLNYYQDNLLHIKKLHLTFVQWHSFLTCSQRQSSFGEALILVDVKHKRLLRMAGMQGLESG